VSWIYRHLIRPGLFTWNPESIHDFTIDRLRQVSRSRVLCQAVAAVLKPSELPVNLFGLHFPNPVGLAAGMDKNGQALSAWEAMGFGFNEIGAVTWYPQAGNPAPRVFRVIPEEAIINRMGFNNAGAEAMSRELRHCRVSGRWPVHPVGINLGKSKVTPLREAAHDYMRSFQVLWSCGDFFVVNVSSPNTPNLRELQDKHALDEILAAMQEVNAAQVKEATTPKSGGAEASGSGPATQGPKPILVKIAPDISWEALDQILELIQPRQIAGLVATNTTTTRPTSLVPACQTTYAETGGLSGRPLRQRSTEVIRHLHRQTEGKVPIIGVGGIFSAADAWEKITAGASLIQVYTGMIYEGPGLAKSIVEGLRRQMASAGLKQIGEAVGTQP
jgi:dihydroorotate dehydrogenase